jgi:hypothetical protein
VVDSIARPLDTATSSEDSSLLHVDFSSEDWESERAIAITLPATRY